MISMLGSKILDFMVKEHVKPLVAEELYIMRNCRFGNYRCTSRNCRKERVYLCGTFFKDLIFIWLSSPEWY
uniref:Uncharacterized protein n=1 Tax=Meloidogyne incognita TaxID=6306 RepID=A0A914LAF4_MELIC